MSYTLDDAHETMNAIWVALHGPTMPPAIEINRAYRLAGIACLKIEADLPEPCEHCGSDQPDPDGCAECVSHLKTWRKNRDEFRA